MINSEQASYKSTFLRKSAYLFLGKAMPVIILFAITILYSRQLSYEEYGKFQSVWMYTNVLGIVMSFGLTSVLLSANLPSLFLFIRRFKKKIVGCYFGLWMLVLAVFFLFGKNFTTSERLLLILFIVTQNISSVLETLLLKYHKEKIIFGVSLGYAVSFFAWHYYVLASGYSLGNLVMGIIGIAVVKLIILISIKTEAQQFAQTVPDRLFSRHWIYTGINDATGVLSKWMDKILLLYLLTPADFGIFFNGSFEIPLFGLLISVAGSVLLIEMSKNIVSNEKVQEVFTGSFHLLSRIVFPLFFFLFFFRNELFAVAFKHKYDLSLPVFVISIFILPLRVNNYSSVLQYYQRGNKIMAGSVIDIIIALSLMLLLYPMLGTPGVAMAVVIAACCQVLYYLWHSARLLNTRVLTLVPVKSLLTTFLIFLVLFAFFYFSISGLDLVSRLIIGFCITSVSIAGGLLLYYSKPQQRYLGFTRKFHVSKK